MKFPIVKVESGLLCGGTPAEAVANTTARKKPGLFGGRQLKPMFLGVNFINGVGEPALQGADFAQEWRVERQHVTRIVGCAG